MRAAMSQHGIFISYRWSDAASIAGRLRDHLEKRFGTGTVFLDTESIKAGEDFSKRLTAELGHVRVIIAIIGKNWLIAKDSYGRRRIDMPGDWVRAELSAALGTTSVEVIPLLVEGCVEVPSTDALPTALIELRRRKAIQVRTEYFANDLEPVIQRMVELGIPTSVAAQSDPAPGADSDCPDPMHVNVRWQMRLMQALESIRNQGRYRLAVAMAIVVACGLAVVAQSRSRYRKGEAPIHEMSSRPPPVASIAGTARCELNLVSIGLRDFGDKPEKNRDGKGFARVAKAFEDINPGVAVRHNAYPHEWMKDHLNEFLKGEEGRDVPDILVWSAGTNVSPYVDLLSPVVAAYDEWHKLTERWLTFVPNGLTVRREGGYFLPFKTYVWAFYYLDDVWDPEWKEPKDLTSLIGLAGRMRRRGLAPIAFGNAHGWPAMGYFDAINMRVRGFSCHQKLVTGNAKWACNRGKCDRCDDMGRTLKKWRELVPLYSEGWYNRTYRAAAKLLADRRAGMFFTGGFFAEELDTSVIKHLRVFAFPHIEGGEDDGGIDAPVDGFVFPKNGKGRLSGHCDAHLKTFAAFLAGADAYHAYDNVDGNPGSSLSVLKEVNQNPKEYEYQVQKVAADMLVKSDKLNTVGGFLDRELKLSRSEKDQPNDPVKDVVIPEFHAFLLRSATSLDMNAILSSLQHGLAYQ